MYAHTDAVCFKQCAGWRERRRRHHMSVWEQRTSQLRRHRQMSSQEAINKEEPPLLNPHASIFRRRKPLENSGPEKSEGEQGGKAERTQGEGSEQQPAPGSNPCPSIREDQRTPSPRAKRDWEGWHHKSFHGNCGLAEQEGGGSVAFEERARLRHSQRRSRHRRVRTEAKESRPAGQEAGPEEVSPAEGEQKKNEEEKQALIEGGQAAAEELESANEAPASDALPAVPPQEPNPAESNLEPFGGSKDASPAEQSGGSLDASEQALLGDLPMDTCRTLSRSEPDLSSVTTNAEKVTESTTIMVDVQDSAVVQSEDLSLFSCLPDKEILVC
ncbi:UNVERIFIED_CONTAM: hypothetical protein K2H54_005928 [Gekko kuhli]